MLKSGWKPTAKAIRRKAGTGFSLPENGYSSPDTDNEPLLFLSLPAPERNRSNQRYYYRHNGYGRVTEIANDSEQEWQVLAENVGHNSPARGPKYAARGVEKQETGPAHMIDPRQESGPGAKHGDEATKEDGLIPMALVEVFRPCHPGLGEPDKPSVTGH